MAYPGDNYTRKEILRALLDKANAQGYLTIDDILEIYPQIGEKNQHQSRLFVYLSHLGVDVLDEFGENIPTDEASNMPPEVSKANTDISIVSTDDTVEIYLKEMSLVPLLKFEEEIALAKRIEMGRKVQTELAKSNAKSNSKKRAELESIVTDGLLAREHIIKANTRLVVSIAKKYMGRGVPFLDLIQEGNLGLMKAVEKYDYKRGFRFSTYATWWIRQTVSRAIADQGRTIRLPVHMNDRIRRLYRTSHELEQALGRPPTPEELAVKLELTPKKVQWLLQVSWIPLSLESPVGDEEDSELGMFVEDQITPPPSQIVYQNMLRERMDKLLATLPPREARILRLRFGLDDNRPYTLEEVGAKFGLTRERIRQIEGKALRRLRHPCRARQLRDYLNS
ncbi:MAG: sigma-70 family RNA polymerase sigma factor [Anaerolineales bacterium]|nr:sigma-70 family RNA polymerase sigma factor [Anaerolineales bacterium]MCK5429954.1 sigma-70 family RNA polymerase sigma factor [Anaerolineales bacterium]